VDIDAVRRIALALPEAYEQASYDDRPSWRTKPRMFAVVGEDPGKLAVWVASLEEKDALLASDPAVFSTTPHHDGHPIVLIDLGTVDEAEARELITDSWRLRASKRAVAAEGREPGAQPGRPAQDG
jgi:hypothetical protein